MEHEPLNEFPDADQIDRYLAGHSDPVEADRVREYFVQYPGAERYQRALHASLAAGVDGSALRAEVAFAALRKRLDHPTTIGPRGRVTWHDGAFQLGMMAMILVVGAITWWKAVAPTASGAARTYATAAGQRAAITLTNGSRVWLGPETRLAVTIDPSDASIVVTMRGEALFTVAHRTDAPFTVRSGNTVTHVLGTTFSVRRYAEDRQTRIVVADGRVSLRGLRGAQREMPTDVHGVVLSANTLGAVDDSGNVVVTSGVAADNYTGRSRGRLVFEKTPVREIVADLSRAYGVSIQLADSALAARALTWTVSVTEKSLPSVLHALATALGAHVTQSANVIQIVPGPSVSHKPITPRLPYTSENQYGR